MADPEGEWIENVFESNPKKPLEDPIPIHRPAESPSMEMSCALVWVSGPNMGCIFFNESWLTFRGRSLQEESGNGWAQGVHPDDLNRCLSIYQTSFQQRKDFLMDYRLLRRDGIFRWIRDKGSPTYSPEGIFSGYVGACVEIHKDGSTHSLGLHFPTKHLQTSATIFDDLNKQQKHQQQRLRRQQFQQLQQQLMKLCQPPPFLPSPTPYPALLPSSAHIPRPKKDSSEYELMKRNMLLEQLSLLGRETQNSFRGPSFFPPSSDPFTSGGSGSSGASGDFDRLGLYPPGSQSTRPLRTTPATSDVVVDSKMGPSPFPDLFQNLGATSSIPTANGSDASPLLHEALLLEQKRILAQQFREQLMMSMQLQKLQNFQHMMHASIGSEMASHLQAALFQQQLDPHSFRRTQKKSQPKRTGDSPEMSSLLSPVNIAPLGFKDNHKRRRVPDSPSSASSLASSSETSLSGYDPRGHGQTKKSKKKYPKEVKVQPVIGQTVPIEATTLSSTTSNPSVASGTSSAFPLLSASYKIEEATPAKVKSTSNGYVCPYAGCTETPRSKFSFNRHLKLHAGTRPYICTYPDCAKKFLESNTLKRHARIHTGERPFVCPVPGCGKSFTDASNFKRHERSHTGEKPYKCVLEGCGRSFTRGSSLKNHLTSHHKLPVTSQELLSAMQTASTLRKQNPSSPSDRVPILKVKKPRRERHPKTHRSNHHLSVAAASYASPSSDASSSPSPASSPSTPARFQFPPASASPSSSSSSSSSLSSSSSPSSPSSPLGVTSTPN